MTLPRAVLEAGRAERERWQSTCSPFTGKHLVYSGGSVGGTHGFDTRAECQVFIDAHVFKAQLRAALEECGVRVNAPVDLRKALIELAEDEHV